MTAPSALASFVSDSKVYFYRLREDDLSDGGEPSDVVASIARKASVSPESIKIDPAEALSAGTLVTIINNNYVFTR